ncbi:MAG: DMT family transporter [Marinifilaceae bacterium]|jgi:drug/metabolite transporter (DMT)-like permease|nr:DMT family transporter [Marinifilaceae bacterium]
MLKKIITSTAFLAIICCLLWATPFVGIKIGLRYNTPLQFAGLRFFLSGFMILPFIPNLRTKLRESFKSWKILINVALVQTTFLYSLFYIGLDMVPGSVGAMIVGSGPIFVAITAHFMMKNDKMNFQKLIAVIIGIVGVMVVSLAGDSETKAAVVKTASRSYGSFIDSNLLIAGIIILMSKNFLGSIGNVLIAKNANHVSPRVLAAFSLTFGGGIILILSEYIENPSWSFNLPAEYFISWIWLSIVSAAAIAIWYTLLQRPGVKVSILNFWTFIIPIFGAILSWTILPNERPNLQSLVGMLIIGISLILINYCNRKKTDASINKIRSYKRI